MKRDMELVRRILLELEASTEFTIGDQALIEAMGVSGDLEGMRDVVWHLKLMEQANLVILKWEEFDNWQSDGPSFAGAQITWHGYDFLAEAANPKIWEAAKAKAGDAFYSLSIGTLQALLSAAARQVVGLP